MSAGLHSFLEAPREPLVPSLFQLLEIIHALARGPLPASKPAMVFEFFKLEALLVLSGSDSWASLFHWDQPSNLHMVMSADQQP